MQEYEQIELPSHIKLTNTLACHQEPTKNFYIYQIYSQPQQKVYAQSIWKTLFNKSIVKEACETSYDEYDHYI